MNRTIGTERHFAYGNISFGYHLILEERSTMSATVFPSRALLVKAPLEATDDKVLPTLRDTIPSFYAQSRSDVQGIQ